MSLFQTHPSLFVLAGSVPLSPSFLRKRRRRDSPVRQDLLYCASALRRPQFPASAGALTADECLTASLEPAAVRKRATSPLPSLQPLNPPPPFPFKKPAPGRAHPCEEARGRTLEALSPLPLDHVPAQPGGGPASRPLPAYLPGSPPGENRGETGGGGEGPSSEPACGAERALRSRRRSGVLPPLLTCAGRRVEGRGVAGNRGPRGWTWRARDVGSPGSGACRRG